jgi:ketosteroid isomerase-like protein
MDLDENDLRDLALSLRLSEVEQLNHAELRVVLAWVSGRSGMGGVNGLTPLLGEPGAEPFLLELVYRQLDGLLFVDDELSESAAWLGGDAIQRRLQYRRLLAAFHPDRTPELAGWLTSRFQAIQRSYRRSRDAPPERFGPRPMLGSPTARAANPLGLWSRSIRFGPGLKALLQNHLRETRNLEAKLVGLAVIAALATVLHVYFAQAPNRWAHAQQLEARQQDAPPGEVSGPPRIAAPEGDALEAVEPARVDVDGVHTVLSPDGFEQVVDVIERYRRAFEEGDIETLMRLLADHPLENRNQGRDWFRSTYSRIFARSDLRRLQVDLETLEAQSEAWIASGQFDLEIHYPGGRQFTASGPIRYRLVEQSQEWHIASIDY